MKSVHALAVAPLAAALIAAGPAASSHPSTTPTSVKVVMSDYDFALSKQKIRHGKATFSVVNVGEVVHDFKINGKKTPYYINGKGGLLRVAFKKPGRYAFICTVPGHVAAGMKGVLIVR